MKILYLDCFAGISGDMFVGAMVDLGVPLEILSEELEKLGLEEYDISSKKVSRQHIGATKFDVKFEEKKVVRTWRNVREIIENSDLVGNVKKNSLEIFTTIAQAEAKIHRKQVDQVHFHEVGGLDSIVDIVSAAIAIEYLGIEKIYSSAVPTGTGMVKTEHGALPVPAPATLELLSGAPIYSSDIPWELTTPTGAAILKHYAAFVEEMPKFILSKVGYGAGSRELDIPNVLRAMLGEETVVEHEHVMLIETNVDDLSAEAIAYTLDLLIEKGALDAWYTPIGMKKGRPGTLISILTSEGSEEEFIDLLFSEVATLGVRIARRSRRIAERELITVATPFGRVHVKIGTYKERVISIAPEYEDCRKLAMKSGVPLREIYELARQSALSVIGEGS